MCLHSSCAPRSDNISRTNMGGKKDGKDRRKEEEIVGRRGSISFEKEATHKTFVLRFSRQCLDRDLRGACVVVAPGFKSEGLCLTIVETYTTC